MSGETYKSMKWDRRRQPRKIPQSFTFLQLEHDEGGRVVNLSEEGLCFETFSPIRTANPVPLWFSFNLRDRIEATGEVVWTDAKKEVGGLAFINLTPAARELIRAHIVEAPDEEALPQPPTASGEPVGVSGAGPANEEAARPGALTYTRGAGLAVVPPVPRLGELRFPESVAVQAAEPRESELALDEVSDSPEQAPLVPLERFVTARRAQFLRGLLLGIVITTLVLVPIFIYALRSQPSATGRAVSVSGSPANAGAKPDPSGTKSPAASPPAVDNPATPPPSPSAKPISDSRGNESAPPSRSAISDSPRSQANPGLSPPVPAASSESPRPKANALNPDQLWEAVQSGNAKAAVALSDLYLRGDGVPANCAQARILLQFAAQKNNPEAIKKSRNLEKSGCPTP